MGVSTEVALPSGSSEAIHVGSRPVVRTNKKSTLVYQDKVLFLFIQAAGLVWNQRAPRVVWNPDEVAHGIARRAYRINSPKIPNLLTR